MEIIQNAEMAEHNDFKKISEEIYRNRAEHERAIKDLFINTEVCSIDVFYSNYHQEIRDINSEITPSRDRPTIADFKDLFHVFEKYPSNLQKPKKAVPKELNRTMALSRVHSVAEINTGNQNKTVAHSSTEAWGQGPTVSEIYSNFREFKQTLNNFLQEVKQKELEADYLTKLQKLSTFAKDIEKLCGTEGRNIQQAFSDDESTRLRCLAVNLEKALFIDANRNLFREEDHFNQQQNLEDVLDLLSYWLNSVGHYKDM